jgi:hypothetical protein
LGRSSKAEDSKQVRNKEGNEAIERCDAGLVAVLEALRRDRVERIEKGEQDKAHEDAPNGLSENVDNDEPKDDPDYGKADDPYPIFGAVDAPIE